MKRISLENQYDGAGCTAALGTFDGVHIGHQRLIREAVAAAKAEGLDCIVCTFDRHPLSVLYPERAPKPLLTLEENVSKFEALGADYTLIRPFTREFADTPPEEYLEMLVTKMRARVIVAGENYTFGRMGKGDANLIVRLAPQLGYTARIVESVADQEGVISSTRIRALIQAGETTRAEALLALGEPETL